MANKTDLERLENYKKIVKWFQKLTDEQYIALVDLLESDLFKGTFKDFK